MDIRTITRAICSHFLQQYHYLGSKGFRQSRIYGLYDNDELVGVCVFHGISAPETAVGAFGLNRNDQSLLYELGRLAIHPRLNGGNHTSWFVSRCLRDMRKNGARAVISYADSGAGHLGSIYRALNAFYCGTTAPKADFYVNGVKQERGKTRGVDGGEWKPRSVKHRYVWVYDRSLTLKWPIVSCNWEGIKR